MHVKSYLEKPQGHIDEVFLRKRSDVEVEEQESNLEEMKDSEDGIDQKDKEKLVREKGYLINEGSPPYYRGARGMQNQVTCVK